MGRALRRALRRFKNAKNRQSGIECRIPRGGHDDVADVCAGALCNVAGVGVKKGIPALCSLLDSSQAGGKTPMQEHLAALARSTIAQLDAEAERARRMNELYENQPMTSPAVWHVHLTQ